MTRLILDAGALVAYERSDWRVARLLQTARVESVPVLTSAMIVAQVWRQPGGRQAALGRLLAGIDVHHVDDVSARAAGILLGRAGTSDAVDAVLALLAQDDDRILTSDHDDMRHLLTTLRRRVSIVRC